MVGFGEVEEGQYYTYASASATHPSQTAPVLYHSNGTDRVRGPEIPTLGGTDSGHLTYAVFLVDDLQRGVDQPALSEVEDMKPTVDIGSRTELLVDEWLVEDSDGTGLKLHPPMKREVVLVADQPYESPGSAYFTVIQDGGLIRMYYRGRSEGGDESDEQTTCYAESTDGTHFERPSLGMWELEGSKDNNIIWKGIESHNLAPMLDTNPASVPEERFKGLGGLGFKHAGLYAFRSPDGIRWEKMRDEPVQTEGAFDSQNIAFWDALAGCYRSYSRYFGNGGRAIQSCTSPDFLEWTKPEANQYAEGVPFEHFYTNATVPCPGAEHTYLSFPKRFVPDRKKVEGHPYGGVSDAVFMTSRDGIHWDRTFLEAWVRPGLDERNWTQRSSMTATGVVQTSPEEFSLYISEHYCWDDNRLRRLTIGRHRFASMSVGRAGGTFTTRPFTFTGSHLMLNYSTSAVGSVQVEVQDENGKPIPGFALSDMELLYGDELDATVCWSGGDLSALQGRPTRLHVRLVDADLYALRTGQPTG